MFEGVIVTAKELLLPAADALVPVMPPGTQQEISTVASNTMQFLVWPFMK